MQRFPRQLARVLIWVATAVVLLVCILFARLFFAPISLDFARDTVIDQAADFLPGWQVDFGSAEVGWDWSGVRPWVVLEDVELIDRRNRLTAFIPETRVELTPGSLITGLSLSTINIRNANVVVTDLGGFSDDTDDSLFSDLFAGGMPKPAVFKPVTEAFSRFTARLLANAPGLEAVNFSNFSVEIVRGADLPAFAASAPTFRLERFQQKLQLAAQLDANMANSPTRVRLGGTAEPAAGTLALSLAFSDLSPSSLSGVVEIPDSIDFMHFPFGLDLQLDMTAQEGLAAAAFEVSIGEGELRHPVQFPGGSPVDYGVIAAQYDVDKDLLTFSEIELSLGGIIVGGEGLLFWQEGYQNPGVRFSLAVDAASVGQVQDYWPIKLHPDGRERGARAWVSQHMLGGTAKNVRFDVTAEPDGSTPYKNGSFFELLFDFEDIDTKYLQTMPPIRSAKGNAVLTQTEFDVFLESGTVEGMSVAGSKAHMHTIHKRGQGVGEFDVNLAGNVRDILELVSPPPVRVKDRIKMDLDRIGGSATVNAKLSVPLIRKAPKELVLYDISASVENGRVSDLLGGEGLTNASIELALNKDDLTASGRGLVNGVDMDLYWRENFFAGREDPGADTSLLVMSGLADEADLLALGVDVQDYLDGEVLAEATFLGRSLAFRVGYFSADASNAVLKVPQIAYQKAPAIAANINGTVQLGKGGTRIEPLTVKGENIDVTASIHWGVGGRGDFVAEVDARQIGRSKLTAEITSRPGLGVDAVVTAERFDLAPLLARDNAEVETAQENVATGESTGFSLKLDAERLDLLNGEALSAAALMLEFDGLEPTNMKLAATNDMGGATTLEVQNAEGELRPITVSSTDAGGVLRGLGLFAHMDQGALTLEGETTGWGQSLQLIGTLKVEDTVLVAKNRLGLEVTEGVISGLDDYLDGGTVDLDVLEMPFSFTEGLLDMSGVKANGPSLGMTMEGQIETREGKINVNGVVVPAYGLNSLLGKIPIVGGLFSGGEGKGLFGVAYRVKGLTEEPDVNVNPLSGLAPGFLRLLFEGSKGKVSDVEAPSASEQSSERIETRSDEQVENDGEPEGDTDPQDEGPAPEPNYK